MKKIVLLLIAAIGLSVTSCKKEADVAPQNQEKLPFALQGGPKKDIGQYD